MVPTLFDGDWDSVIVFTYGANLPFYERDLWRQIERAKTRIVFADGRQVTRHLLTGGASGTLRLVNRAYMLAPIDTDHAAHAKLLLFLSEERGRLAVGSGNLGLTGYASQGECFTTYHWTPDNPAHLAAFGAAKSFIDDVVDAGLVDGLVRPRVQQAWQDAPWIYQAGDGALPLQHNLHRPLIGALVDALAGRDVQELVLHAPFYDHGCHALAELLDRLRPKRVQVLLQERITSVDPTRLAAVLAASGCTVDVRTVEAEDTGTFLHAKFVIARLANTAVCLQGSPNLSTPALLQAHPDGNIELANLLEGHRDAFNHLVNHLVVGRHNVEIDTLGLGLTSDDADDALPSRRVRDLAWVPSRLRGVFDSEVSEPPILLIGSEEMSEIDWELEDPVDGRTRFTATLGDKAASLLNRVDAVTFRFVDGESTAPTYPYHLNSLAALASGQGRTDLLKHAGAFDLGDEELEDLLTQLDEVLVVDGRSLWRMLKREGPKSSDDTDDQALHLNYDDLDWVAIRSHPKLAAFHTRQHRGHADPTGLGIVLNSIASKFRTEVAQRRSGSVRPTPDSRDNPDPEDPFTEPDPESEEAAEDFGAETERRRQGARARARRLYRSFVQRFVNGLTDEEFVQHVGPSVIVPSYVVFNHLCRKLAQLDLVDRAFAVDSQVALWRFFWGTADEPGYLSSMSEPEQLAALGILDAHDEEAARLASVYQAYGITWEGRDDDVVRLRDQWRVILTHDLGGVSAKSIADAASVSSVGPEPLPAKDFVSELIGLADFTPDRELLACIATIAGCAPGQVRQREVTVHRNGNFNAEVYEIVDPAAELAADLAVAVLAELARLRPDLDYLRVSHPPTGAVAFVDYEHNRGIWASSPDAPGSDLVPPTPSTRAWDQVTKRLFELAA